MKILVCIKQVPGTTAVDIDPETGVLKRSGVESKMNPYDLFALETAFRIREKTGGEVFCLTMGPPQAESVLREAYMMGADGAILLSDRRFSGSDVLATSHALSQAILKTGPYDLILCGKQTTDGDTAQVGPAIAERLSLPHAAWVNRILDVTKTDITLQQDLSESVETAFLPFPCLITVEKDIFSPRLPSYKRKVATRDREINRLSFSDLPDGDEKNYGLSGSPTKVEKIFPPSANEDRILYEGGKEELCDKIYSLLSQGKFI